MLQVREISLRKWSAWWFYAFAHLQEHWLQKMHVINQGWANLFNRRVIFRNQKHPRAAKPV